MQRRERILLLLLFATAAVTAWSAAGFPLGEAPTPMPAAALPPTLPCPPGFVPSAETRRLPDVPPAELLPANPGGDVACIALAAPTPR